MDIKYIIAFFLASLNYLSSIAQDPNFNQNDNSSIYLNPAFTGINKSSSLDLTYRNQWPELSGNYLTTSISMNQFLGKGNGVSLLYTNDNAAKILITHRMGAAYAKQLTIKEKHHLSIGIQVMYFQKKLDWGKLTFGNQIDPRRGFVYNSHNQPQTSTSSGVDFNSGLLYHNDYFFAGIGIHHLTEPEKGIVSNAILPRKYNFQLGGKFALKELVFVPFIQGISQGSFSTIIGSIKTKYKKLELDLGYANGNGIIGGSGVRFAKWNIGYNYGLSLSKFSFLRASTHEIRIGFRPKILKKTNEHYFDFY